MRILFFFRIGKIPWGLSWSQRINQRPLKQLLRASLSSLDHSIPMPHSMAARLTSSGHAITSAWKVFRTYSRCRFPAHHVTITDHKKPVHPRKRYSYIGRAITIWFENIDLMVAFANAISVGFYFSPPVLLYARSADSQHYFSSP